MSIERDENGCPIVPGAYTFGHTVKVRGGKRSGQKFYFKERAEERLIALMRKGSEGDRMTKRAIKMRKDNLEYMKFQQELSMVSKSERFMYYSDRAEELQKELDDLESCGNTIKINLKRPIIEKQIQEALEEMSKVYEG